MFYTYMHIRNDTGQVFYIGKGKGDRAWKRQGRNSRWSRTAQKVGITVEVVASWKIERDALDHEILLISIFRELGHPLANLTDGGEGQAGLSPSEETRQRLSAAMREYLADDDVRRERGERLKRVWQTQVGRDRFIENIKSHHADPEWKATHKQAIRESMSTQEYKQKKSASSKALWDDNVYRSKICKPVFCATNNKLYESSRAAAKDLGLNCGNVSNVCRGRARHSGGHVFMFAAPTPQPHRDEELR